jgi:hypothetical protein
LLRLEIEIRTFCVCPSTPLGLTVTIKMRLSDTNDDAGINLMAAILHLRSSILERQFSILDSPFSSLPRFQLLQRLPRE